MIIGPKYKICKRLGASVFEKCQTTKFQLAEARAPRQTKAKRGGSDFGVQMLEKQKVRFTYGLSEGQFSRYVREAMGEKADSRQVLIHLLESRLDNVVFRAGYAKTRRAARQFVSHGHIMVNGRRMMIPSYRAQVGDVIAIRPESRTSPLFANRTEAAAETTTPTWMAMEDEGFAAKISVKPMIAETETPFNAATIIQFYSR